MKKATFKIRIKTKRKEQRNVINIRKMNNSGYLKSRQKKRDLYKDICNDNVKTNKHNLIVEYPHS